MNDRLALIDKVAAELHDRRRRRNREHGAIKASDGPGQPWRDRFAIAGECVGCRDDATYVVDELGPILQEATR